MVLKHYTQRSLISNLRNLWFGTRMRYRALVGISGRLAPPSEYQCVFEDDFKTVDPLRWRWGQPWGNFHPKQQWWWWPKSRSTPSDVVYPTHEGLALELRNYPKTFYNRELPEHLRANSPAEWRADWAAGLISSRKSFKWGWIEAEIQLPAERGQWSAFWLSGDANWPPEIDIFEAYTGSDPDVVSVQPNIHWGPAGVGDWRQGKKDWGAPTIPLYAPHRRFIQYACHWTPDWIRIYYDGVLVSECTITSAIENNAQRQYIILNHGCKDPAVTGWTPMESAMLVKNLKVYQHPDWIEKPTGDE